MKNQALFSLKDKSKKSKCRLLQFSFGALRVQNVSCYMYLPFWEVDFTIKGRFLLFQVYRNFAYLCFKL